MRFSFLILLLIVFLFVITGCAQEDISPPIGDSVGDQAIDDGVNTDVVPKGDFCDDSDNGITFFVKGEVVDAQGAYTDECISAEVVREHFCKENAMHYEDYECLYGCNDGVCLKESVDEEEMANDDDENITDESLSEDIICGGRNSIPCPEGYACFNHPNAQPEFGFCQKYELFPEGDDHEGLIQCPPTKIDPDECPKGLDRVCATYYDTIKQRETFKKFDSACLACADSGTIAYKFGRC